MKMLSKYTIKIPSYVNDKDHYINVIMSEIKMISHLSPSSTINIFSDIICQPIGYFLRSSTRLYNIMESEQCLSDFFGKLEQYTGTDTNQTLFRSINVVSDDQSFIDKIVRIQDLIDSRKVEVNPFMPESMANAFANLVISNKTVWDKNNVDADRMNLLNKLIDESNNDSAPSMPNIPNKPNKPSTSNEPTRKSPSTKIINKYERAVKIIKYQKSLPLADRNIKLLGRNVTLADRYIETYNITKQH